MNSKLLLGILAAAAAGVLVGMLIAPEKGSDTREKLSEKAGEAVDTLKKAFDDFMKMVKEKYAMIRGEVENDAEEVKSAATF